MGNEIQHADRRLRRVTAIVLAIATILAVALVLAFHRWLSDYAASVPTGYLVKNLRGWIGLTAFAGSLCLFALAAYTAMRARRATAEQRWPVQAARVLRDTVVRHGDDALRIARLLNLVALVLVAIAAAAILLGWRLFSV